MDNKAFRCAICGEEFGGFGNNPYPVRTGKNDRCCDLCNNLFVIPFRIAMARFDHEKYGRIAEVLDGLDIDALSELVEVRND